MHGLAFLFVALAPLVAAAPSPLPDPSPIHVDLSHRLGRRSVGPGITKEDLASFAHDAANGLIAKYGG
jgi:hypothetical protein